MRRPRQCAARSRTGKRPSHRRQTLRLSAWRVAVAVSAVPFAAWEDRSMDEPQYDYDLLVIGTGPGGQKAAIQAAKLRKRVAIVERREMVGGVCINTGTIPSKTLREAVLHLSGYRHRSFYGESYTVKEAIAMADLL